MVIGWNLWVWLECIGVVIIIITFPTPLVLRSSFFWQQHPYFIIHFKNVFSFLFILFLCEIYSKRCSENIRDCSNIEIRE